jgi:predicted DNA-binding transcriptional regulator AlpA
MGDRLLKTADVLSRVQVSRPTLYRWMSEGRFPLPSRPCGVNLWRESDIARWIADLPPSDPSARSALADRFGRSEVARSAG